MKTSLGLFALIVASSLYAGPTWSEGATNRGAQHPAPATMAPAPTASATGEWSGMGPSAGMMGANAMAMMGNMPMMPGMMSSHVEGRLAFLKTELKITADQSAQWDRFADAYRAAANSMNTMPGLMTGMMRGDLPSRLAAHQKMMAMHLNALNTISGPLNGLYGALNAEQKREADGLFGMGGM